MWTNGQIGLALALGSIMFAFGVLAGYFRCRQAYEDDPDAARRLYQKSLELKNKRDLVRRAYDRDA